jgi:hypothetical protein
MSVFYVHVHGNEQQYVRGHAAWTKGKDNKDMQLEHGHGPEAWTLTCGMDINMQHVHGYGRTWKRVCSMDIDMDMVH